MIHGGCGAARVALRVVAATRHARPVARAVTALSRLRPRPVRPAGWWFDLLLLAGFALLTGLLATGGLLGVDQAVSDWCSGHRPGAADWVARKLNYLGNGGPLTLICLAIAIPLAVRGRTVRPVLPVVAAFLVTGIVIMPIKLWTDRPAPSSMLPDAAELFHDTLPPGITGESYPSGHLVNVVVWYGVLAMLLSPWLAPALRRWLRWTPPVVVFATTIYLNFHWATDAVAGLLLGVFLDRLLTRTPWGDLHSRLPPRSCSCAP